MCGRQQRLERVAHERRITEISVAIGERATFGLGQHMHTALIAIAPLIERIRRRDVEYLADRRTARTRRRRRHDRVTAVAAFRSEEHTSELQSLMRISYAVFCLKNKTNNKNQCATTA